MNTTGLFVSGRSRHAALVLAGVLLMALIASSCSLSVSPDGVEAVTPHASVSLSPATFCVGEILTATYDGGPQVSSCGTAPDSQECKGASLVSGGADLSLPFGYEAGNLQGSVSGPAQVLIPVSSTYEVEWEAWSSNRDMRVPARSESGQTWTGRIQASDSVEPILNGGWVTYTDTKVCDEETHTVRFGRSPSVPPRFIDTDDELGTPGISFRRIVSGELSACAAIDQVCISPTDVRFGPWRLSVDGGPSVLLGGTDYPRCTDAFAGYQPEDILLESPHLIGYGPGSPPLGAPCNPNDLSDFGWPGVPIVQYHVAGSTMCAVDHENGDLGIWHGGSLTQFRFGTIPLRGAALTRCLDSLDPAFVAQIPLVPVDVVEGEEYPPAPPLPITSCDLVNSCGDTVCQAGCEDAVNCSQDCEPSETNCPPGTYYAPVTNQCIAIQIVEPKKDNGGGDDGGGGACPAGQSWTCNLTNGKCSCK